MRRNRRRARRGKNTAALKIMVVLLVIALFGVGGMAVYAYNNYMNTNRMMRTVVSTERIYKNIFINGINVGGMTSEAAELLLRKEFIPSLQENTISVTAGDHVRQFTFGEFRASYDFSSIVDKAFQYGKSGSLLERYNLVTALDDKPVHINEIPVYTYDRSNVASKLTPLRDAINIEPLSASITRQDGQFIVSDSRIGRLLNVDVTTDLIIAVLDSQRSGSVVAVIDEILPEFEVSDFDALQSLLGSFSTKVAPGSSDRNQNIINALSKINDVVLAPGEVFSTNKHFGAMTYANGYRMAPVIVGGQLEDGMGGGVCQVSSTLYNAVLFAELEIVERRNHSLMVTYVKYGFDATLAGNYIDFRFRNDTDSPVFVEALFTEENEVLINLYGRETRSPGRSISFANQLVETVQPSSEPIETLDPTLPLGERQVKQRTSPGYRYRVYKTVYEHGVEVDKILINTSYYRPTQGEILVGTGGADTLPDDAVSNPDRIENEIDISAYDPAPIQPDDWIAPDYPVMPDFPSGLISDPVG